MCVRFVRMMDLNVGLSALIGVCVCLSLSVNLKECQYKNIVDETDNQVKHCKKRKEKGQSTCSVKETAQPCEIASGGTKRGEKVVDKVSLFCGAGK